MVRTDISRGLQSANLIHGAGESSPGNLPEGTHAVALAVPDELALHHLAAKLEAADVRFVRIVESDAPYAGALMALGLVPARKETLRRHLSSYPLLR